jgi:hypothetical protein
MVQKGKFAACAFAFDKQLNKVDLPTFGKPTIPHCNAILRFFRLASSSISSLANNGKRSQRY